jgi:hypothetical protein
VVNEFWKYMGYPHPSHIVRNLFEVIGNPPDTILFKKSDALIDNLIQFSEAYMPENITGEQNIKLWRARAKTNIGRLARHLSTTEKAIQIFEECAVALKELNQDVESLIVNRELRSSLIETGKIEKAQNIPIIIRS